MHYPVLLYGYALGQAPDLLAVAPPEAVFSVSLSCYFVQVYAPITLPFGCSASLRMAYATESLSLLLRTVLRSSRCSDSPVHSIDMCLRHGGCRPRSTRIHSAHPHNMRIAGFGRVKCIVFQWAGCCYSRYS